MAIRLSALLLALASAGAAADPGLFSTTGLQGWLPQTFSGKAATRYRLAAGAVEARCDAGASGLMWKERIDLARTPVLAWRWRVEGVLSGTDERTKPGDDFPARVYVVRDGGLAPWRTRSLVYVWASREASGRDWPSPYTRQAHVVALRSGAAQAGQWLEERRDVRADFQRYFGLELGYADGVALMTDCDDTASAVTAGYGDVRLESHRR